MNWLTIEETPEVIGKKGLVLFDLMDTLVLDGNAFLHPGAVQLMVWLKSQGILIGIHSDSVPTKHFRETLKKEARCRPGSGEIVKYWDMFGWKEFDLNDLVDYVFGEDDEQDALWAEENLNEGDTLEDCLREKNIYRGRWMDWGYCDDVPGADSMLTHLKSYSRMVAYVMNDHPHINVGNTLVIEDGNHVSRTLSIRPDTSVGLTTGSLCAYVNMIRCGEGGVDFLTVPGLSMPQEKFSYAELIPED